ncbi:MAG: hypothetical protein AAGF95_01510 [Chloroflexota bacterium]
MAELVEGGSVAPANNARRSIMHEAWRRVYWLTTTPMIESLQGVDTTQM